MVGYTWIWWWGMVDAAAVRLTPKLLLSCNVTSLLDYHALRFSWIWLRVWFATRTIVAGEYCLGICIRNFERLLTS